MKRGRPKNKSQTDWKNPAERPDEAIDTSDIPELDEAFFRKAKIRLADGHVILEYDREADVLCVIFRKSRKRTETVKIGDGVLVHKAGERIVGLTILNVQKR